ncbi:MAG: FAD-dependent oxidoreductase, partial [Deltaproteobacteria bacterium]|nr:FAD-dependent oxidoreductase [Deltaproteobacteria bacterium]
EEVCRRGEVNEPVSICALKRYAADNDKGLWRRNTKVAPDTGKKVAVVGAGPAGLTAAFYLRKRGHGVALFEARSRAGGMMRYGIPRYRLPEEVLDREIGDILALGVEFLHDRAVGRDVSLDQLKEEGFHAVFLGVGAQLSRRISLEGADHPEVLWGVDLLGKVAEGDCVRLKDRVIVVGGGNAAVDAALTAMRCGAKEVTMVCPEKRHEMPAQDWQVQGALEEGVALMTSWGPHRILNDKGRITGMELIHCTAVFDDKGAFSPTFDDRMETIEGDQVILAIGQTPDLSFLPEAGGVAVNRGLIVVDRGTLETGMKGVYAGGDATGTPGTIIHAVAVGRKAASSIDRALGGVGEIDEVLFARGEPSQHVGRDEGFALWPRERAPEIDVEERRQGFREVASGFSDEQALKEARRCLQCDLRLYLKANPSPPLRILPFTEENVNRVPNEEGVFLLYDAEKKVIAIKGTAVLRQTLLEALEEYESAEWFEFEEDKLYSKRESERMQQYLHEHGSMPGGGNDDLF